MKRVIERACALLPLQCVPGLIFRTSVLRPSRCVREKYGAGDEASEFLATRARSYYYYYLFTWLETSFHAFSLAFRSLYPLFFVCHRHGKERTCSMSASSKSILHTHAAAGVNPVIICPLIGQFACVALHKLELDSLSLRRNTNSREALQSDVHNMSQQSRDYESQRVA